MLIKDACLIVPKCKFHTLLLMYGSTNSSRSITANCIVEHYCSFGCAVVQGNVFYVECLVGRSHLVYFDAGTDALFDKQTQMA